VIGDALDHSLNGFNLRLCGWDRFLLHNPNVLQKACLFGVCPGYASSGRPTPCP
jgi:hypothetical protein